MSAFCSEFLLQRAIGRDEWHLAGPLHYKSDLCGGAELVIPAGFQTDFASIPRVFYRVLPPHGEYDAPAVVHDYLYATGVVRKSMADAIFNEAMAAIGVPGWKRVSMYNAVRFFGFAAWNGHRANDTKTAAA